MDVFDAVRFPTLRNFRDMAYFELLVQQRTGGLRVTAYAPQGQRLDTMEAVRAVRHVIVIPAAAFFDVEEHLPLPMRVACRVAPHIPPIRHIITIDNIMEGGFPAYLRPSPPAALHATVHFVGGHTPGRRGRALSVEAMSWTAEVARAVDDVSTPRAVHPSAASLPAPGTLNVPLVICRLRPVVTKGSPPPPPPAPGSLNVPLALRRRDAPSPETPTPTPPSTLSFVESGCAVRHREDHGLWKVEWVAPRRGIVHVRQLVRVADIYHVLTDNCSTLPIIDVVRVPIAKWRFWTDGKAVLEGVGGHEGGDGDRMMCCFACHAIPDPPPSSAPPQPPATPKVRFAVK